MIFMSNHVSHLDEIHKVHDIRLTECNGTASQVLTFSLFSFFYWRWDVLLFYGVKYRIFAAVTTTHLALIAYIDIFLSFLSYPAWCQFLDPQSFGSKGELGNVP